MLKRAALGALCIAFFAGLNGCGSTSQPAATVNGHDISMAAYHAQLDYKRQVASYNGQVDGCQAGSPRALCSQLKSSALTDLIDDELVQEYASRHNITITQATFNRAWTQIYAVRFQHNPALLDAFVKRMQISVDDLKSRIKQDLLNQAVSNRVAANAPTVTPGVHVAAIYAPTLKVSQTVQSQLRAGMPFLTVAANLARIKNGPCSTPGSCGDLGWTPDVLIPSYQHFLLNEPVGKPIGPIRLQQGYQYYLVEAKRPHYSLTQSQQVAMRSYVFSQWLGQQERRASVKRYAAT